MGISLSLEPLERLQGDDDRRDNAMFIQRIALKGLPLDPRVGVSFARQSVSSSSPGTVKHIVTQQGWESLLLTSSAALNEF